MGNDGGRCRRSRASASSRLSRHRCPAAEDFPVDVVIASAAEPQRLGEFAGQLVQKAFASGLFIFADTDVKFDQPQVEVVFDRDKLRSQGVDLRQAGSRSLDTDGRQLRQPVQHPGPQLQGHPAAQTRRTSDGRPAAADVHHRFRRPAGSTLDVRQPAHEHEPRELKKFQQLNAVRIQGVIPPPVPLDQALSFLEQEASAALPEGFTIDYAGQSRQLRTEGSRFLGMFLLSALLIYLVLAAQFESFRDPFIILAGSVPLALSGALLFSFLQLTTLNIYSQVGLITLVGLVSKNGILIVQFANHLQETGREKFAAVIEAAGTRLRPILMTTAATVFGHLPLVFATGPRRGEPCNSIGIMLVSGMIIGTLFTLFVVPSIYVLLARKHEAAVAEDDVLREIITGRASEGAAA